MNQDNQQDTHATGQQPFVPSNKRSGEKKHNATRIIILSMATVLLGVVVLYLGMLLFMGDYRGTSKESAARRHITQVLPAVILCIDKGEAVYPPQDGGLVCAGQEYTWPELALHGASWGGCPFRVDTNLENPEETQFKYCATMPDGSLATCTGGEEYGCSF